MPALNLTGPAAAYLRKRLDLTETEAEVLRYGMQIVAYTVSSLGSIALAGWLAGALPSTLGVAFSAAALRAFSGGAHSRSPLTCNLLGAAMTSLLGKAAQTTVSFLAPPVLLPVLLAAFIPAAIAVWRLAPVDSPAKPITSLARRHKLRRLSLAALFVLTTGQLVLLHGWPALALAVGFGTWWQAFTLTAAGHRFATVLDNFAEIRKG